jgi:hypothetical protein
MRISQNQLCHLYRSSHIARIVKSKRLRWTVYVAKMRRLDMHAYRMLVETPLGCKCDLSGCPGPGEGETEDNTRAAIKCR